MSGGGRPALILGAGSDIARALAAIWAAESASGKGRALILAGRATARLEEDAADLRARFDAAVEVRHWDAEGPDPAAILDDLPETPGVVVCAAGTLEGDLEQLARVNFLGPARVLEAAAPRLAALSRETGEATAIAGFGSVAGMRGRASNRGYGAAKAGLMTVLSGLRQAHAGGGLTVVTAIPGRAETRMTEGMANPPFLTASAQDEARRLARAIARGRPLAMAPVWRLIGFALTLVPEAIFARLKG